MKTFVTTARLPFAVACLVALVTLAAPSAFCVCCTWLALAGAAWAAAA